MYSTNILQLYAKVCEREYRITYNAKFKKSNALKNLLNSVHAFCSYCLQKYDDSMHYIHSRVLYTAAVVVHKVYILKQR